MAESSTGTPSSTDDPLADFGANEWLVDEMYERYQRDPKSVDKVWWDFFEKGSPEKKSSDNGRGSSNGGQQAKQAKPESKPEKKGREEARAGEEVVDGEAVREAEAVPFSGEAEGLHHGDRQVLDDQGVRGLAQGDRPL